MAEIIHQPSPVDNAKSYAWALISIPRAIPKDNLVNGRVDQLNSSENTQTVVRTAKTIKAKLIINEIGAGEEKNSPRRSTFWDYFGITEAAWHRKSVSRSLCELSRSCFHSEPAYRHQDADLSMISLTSSHRNEFGVWIVKKWREKEIPRLSRI